MKKINFIPVNRNSKIQWKWVAVFFIVLTLSTERNPLKAQYFNCGITVKAGASGCGIGTSIFPEVFMNKRRQSISLGLNMQVRNCNISGMRAEYQYTLNPHNEGLELFVFYQLGWHRNAILGKRSLEYESIISPENTKYMENVKLHVIENHLGFGMNITTVYSWDIVAAIGLGFYKSIAIKNEEMFQYRQPSNNSMLLSIGIKHTFKQLKILIRPRIRFKLIEYKPIPVEPTLNDH